MKLHKRVVNVAKKQYFKELFDSRSNSVKQLWNNLNQVASLSKHKNANNVQKLLVNNCFTEDNKAISLSLIHI